MLLEATVIACAVLRQRGIELPHTAHDFVAGRSCLGVGLRLFAATQLLHVEPSLLQGWACTAVVGDDVMSAELQMTSLCKLRRQALVWALKEAREAVVPDTSRILLCGLLISGAAEHAWHQVLRREEIKIMLESTAPGAHHNSW